MIHGLNLASAEEALAFVGGAIKEDLLGSGYALIVTDRRIVGIRTGGAANVFGGLLGVEGLGALGKWALDPARKTLELGAQDLDQLVSQKKGSWTVPFDELEKLEVKQTTFDRKLKIKSRKEKGTYRHLRQEEFDKLKEVLPSLPLTGKLGIS